MACELIPKRAYLVAFIYTVLVSQACNGFYLSENYMHTYSTGDEIYAKVNSLTSIETALPFSYYSLPYCIPPMGIKKSAENLGQLLMGDQILNSPYRFRMNVNESVFLCTTSPLSEHEVKLLKQRTRDLYQVNMILDNLPAMRFAQQNGIKIQWTGFPVGYALPNSNEDYIINHLKFRVLVNEYERVGVQIIGPGEEGMGVILEADEKVASGYEIVGLETARSDLTMYAELDKKAQVQMNKQLSGWRLVVGDVFREPNHSKLLCVMIGDGVQITGTTVVTIVFAAFGFMSPASHGMLLTGMIIFYLFLGTIAGYAGVRLWITIKGTSDGWRSVAWSVACCFPGICFVILTVLNFILWDSKSTRAIPVSLYFVLLSLWFCISVPLTLLGVPYLYEPARYQERSLHANIHHGFLFLGPGPFHLEQYSLNFSLSSLASGSGGSIMSLDSCLLSSCCWSSYVQKYLWSLPTCISVVRTDSGGGKHSIHQGLNGSASAILYLGYSLIMAIAIMISTGTIGFLTSFPLFAWTSPGMGPQ
ncbi:hypothetical protein ACSBR1_028474 [Camellia fascicularis]